MQLYRPVGLVELRLIFEAEMAAFPLRLPEQPIFYPVLNEGYARQIAWDWNTASNSFAGYVTQFTIDGAYAAQFPPHVVGASQHVELWTPAEHLDEFNQHLTGKIAVTDAYFGERFHGFIPDRYGLSGHDAIQQFLCLAGMEPYVLSCETDTNRAAIFLHFPFWARYDFSHLSILTAQRDALWQKIHAIWQMNIPEIPLCYGEYF